ncbi:hypothetical protein SELMODRAFT_413189 [Selaginella moellendorffii]|uniref:Uncharacterized protein n=1 Tax=Selaginella moellendorffii TaxID=88036 RepID=D8RNM4_SELML|nr:hypothetical protein SELMODRAFT_413189 [Selaginella moellendorffii]
MYSIFGIASPYGRFIFQYRVLRIPISHQPQLSAISISQQDISSPFQYTLLPGNKYDVFAKLDKNRKLTNTKQQYFFVMLDNCNLVLIIKKTIGWSSNIVDISFDCEVILQPDGNMECASAPDIRKTGSRQEILALLIFPSEIQDLLSISSRHMPMLARRLFVFQKLLVSIKRQVQWRTMFGNLSWFKRETGVVYLIIENIDQELECIAPESTRKVIGVTRWRVTSDLQFLMPATQWLKETKEKEFSFSHVRNKLERQLKGPGRQSISLERLLTIFSCIATGQDFHDNKLDEDAGIQCSKRLYSQST